MGTNFKDYHNRLMARHSELFDTYASISYSINSVIQNYKVKCTINSITDVELDSGSWTSDTRDFTFRIDDLKVATETKTKVAKCILSEFKGKDIIYDGTRYSIVSENPNGSTQDCVVLRGVIKVAQ